MRKTKEEADITRERLLDAALVAFGRRGYAATRLEDIARETQVTRGAIYHHFGNKVQLYRAILQERFARTHSVVEQALVKGDPPLQNLRRLMVRLLTYLEEDAGYQAVLALAAHRNPGYPELAEAIQEEERARKGYRNRLTSLIQAAIAAGEARPSLNPEDAAVAVMGLLDGVSYMWLSNPKEFSLADHAEGVADVILKGIST